LHTLQSVDDDVTYDRKDYKLLRLRCGDNSAYYQWLNVTDLFPILQKNLLMQSSNEQQQLWACVGAAAEPFISALATSS
jgi:hypothetical protein